MSIIAYGQEMCDYGYDTFILNPAGRWKITYNANSKPSGDLFIEHKGWLFKSWVSEGSIIFGEEERETINECATTQSEQVYFD